MKQFLRQFVKSLQYALFIVLVFWIIKWVEYLFDLQFYTLGIYPRTVEGLLGVLTSPFVHGDFGHLIANSVPMLILGTLLFFFYGKRGIGIFVLLWLTSGILTWIIGRESWHIGASSVIYALAFFLVFGGLFSKSIKLILVSVIVAVAYSGLIFGLFPVNGQISWEGHFAGAFTGFFWAYIFRNNLRSKSDEEIEKV